MLICKKQRIKKTPDSFKLMSIWPKLYLRDVRRILVQDEHLVCNITWKGYLIFYT